MDIWKQDALMRDEAAVLRLKSLYRQYGYTPFRMSRFEEYDFYADNRSFLQSESVITFTDLNGKLMALKPDVTLSIVKGAPDDGEMQKVFYSENVYRADNSQRERSFREIMQVGLECIGRVDLYSQSEVMTLAARSLHEFSKDFTLDVSHMGFVTGMLEELTLSKAMRAKLIEDIGRRNISALRLECAGLEEDYVEGLCAMASVYGSFGEELPKLRAISRNRRTDAALDELESLCAVLEDEGFAQNLHLDFSIMNDMRYYNGVTFLGFVDGVPRSVLSGGRYDNLLRKMGKDADAIGFAIYLDALDRLLHGDSGFEADVLLTYDAQSDAATVAKAARDISLEGKSVRVQRTGLQSPRCKEELQMIKGKVKMHG